MSVAEWLHCIATALNEFDPLTGRTVGGTILTALAYLGIVGAFVYFARRLIDAALSEKP